MGEMADEILSICEGLYWDGRFKKINPYYDTNLWRGSNNIVRHLECMDSLHLMKVKELLQQVESSKDRVARATRIRNIDKILKKRGYTEDVYMIDNEGFNLGLRANFYENESIIKFGEFLLGSGDSSEVDYLWWERFSYINQ